MVGEATVDLQPWHGLEELRASLRGFLARHCQDENDVEDVIQETFMRAARYRKNLHDGRRLRPWAMRIALNVLSDARRKRGRTAGALGVEGLQEALETQSAAETEALGPQYQVGNWLLAKDQALRILARALEILRADDRRLFSAYYGGRESCREAAGRCGIPAHLVKIRLFRARRRCLRAMRKCAALETWTACERRTGT